MHGGQHCGQCAAVSGAHHNGEAGVDADDEHTAVGDRQYGFAVCGGSVASPPQSQAMAKNVLSPCPTDRMIWLQQGESTRVNTQSAATPPLSRRVVPVQHAEHSGVYAVLGVDAPPAGQTGQGRADNGALCR